MNIFYPKDKDKSLIVSVDKFQYSAIKSNKPLSKQVNSWTYAEQAFESLSVVDERFKNVSSNFKNEVIIRSFCAEFNSCNLKNRSKDAVLYPTYLDVLKGINYFSLILKLEATNSSENSIMNEVEFFKQAYNKKYNYKITPDDKDAFEFFKKIKAS